MGMMSKQDMDVAVKVLQDKVEFVLKSFSVTKTNPFDPFQRPETKTLLDVYYEVQSGKTIEESVETFDEPEQPIIVEADYVSVDESENRPQE